MKKLLLIILFFPLVCFSQGKRGTITVKKAKKQVALDTLKEDNGVKNGGDNTIVLCLAVIPGLMNESEVSLQTVLNSLSLEIWDTTVCKISIVRYPVLIVRGEKTIKMTNEGKNFEKETKDFFLRLKPGDKLSFGMVQCKYSDGERGTAMGATYKIKE